MAKSKHVEILARGPRAWNRWRTDHPNVAPDLERADLTRADLREARLCGANLVEANLGQANLLRADLTRANLLRANLGDALLAGADLSGAVLGWANLTRSRLWFANLSGANLIKSDLGNADLGRANLSGAELAGASFRGTRLRDTVLTNVDLSRAEHLITCRHDGPSSIDHRTLDRSGTLPLSFLRGCGLPEALIDSLTAVLGGDGAYETCFIRADPEDVAFAERLWADLQHEGVRCWCGPENPRDGEVTREAGRQRARIILILSEHAVESEWIHDEVAAMLDEERRTLRATVVPVRIDDAVVDCAHPWFERIRRHHPVRDFSEWRNRLEYRGSLGRLLCDLRAKPSALRRGTVASLSAARARGRHAERLPA